MRLYSTDQTVVAVDSPVKIRILELVAGGPVPFDTLVRQTGKVKSTVSVHVHDLERSGLVAVRPDLEDTRKRLIELSSDAIGRLTNRDRNILIPQFPLPMDRGAFTGEDKAAFFIYCYRVLRTQAMAMGINVDPLMRRTGMELGAVLARQFGKADLQGFATQLNDFYQANDLGTISIAGNAAITVDIHDCFECHGIPSTGHCVCAFNSGVFNSVFSYLLHRPVTAVEQRCVSAGYDRCRFVITPHPERTD